MAVFKVSNGNDSGAGSLRKAINLANANSGADQIQIDVAEISLDKKIAITDSVAIAGNGVAITQTKERGIFRIDDQDNETFIDVSMEDLTLTGANSATPGGGIQVWENLTLDNLTFKDNTAAQFGGAVYGELGDLIIRNSLFQNNSAVDETSGNSNGGAVAVSGTNSLTIENSVFDSNVAEDAAVLAELTIFNFADSEIINSSNRGLTVDASLSNIDNSLFANNAGSGIASLNRSNLTINNISTTNNNGIFGGGLNLIATTGTITNSLIKENTASDAGGGISIADSMFSLIDSVVSDNSAPFGSGIEVYGNSKLDIENAHITNNAGSSKQVTGTNVQYLGVNANNPTGESPQEAIGYEPLVEKSTPKEPAIEEASTQDATEEAVKENPPEEKPATEEPINEELGIEESPEESGSAQPASQESLTEELSNQNPVEESTEAMAKESSAAAELTGEKRATESAMEQATENSPAEESAEDVTSENSTEEEPTTEASTTEESATGEEATETLVTEPNSGEQSTEAQKPNMELATVNRFYHEEKGFHFYSADAKEIAFIKDETAKGNLGYKYEGETFQGLAKDLDSLTGETIEGASAVYRFLNEETGAHLYTMDEKEKDYILENLDNYALEGTAYYAFEAEQETLETVPVYRMLNTLTGTHLFTSDANEFAFISENLDHFNVEASDGIAFHVMEV